MRITDELECLTGKLIRGNITPIVYELITRSGTEVTLEDIDNLTQEEKDNDNTGRNGELTLRKNSSLPSIEELLRHSRPL